MTSTTPNLFDPLPNLIPGPEGNPNDRGECLALNTETMKRCDGRRIASREYREGQGFIVRWTCNKCDWEDIK